MWMLYVLLFPAIVAWIIVGHYAELNIRRITMEPMMQACVIV